MSFSLRGLLAAKPSVLAAVPLSAAPAVLGSFFSNSIRSSIPGLARLNDWTQNAKLRRFIQHKAEILQPDSIHLCDGSPEEFQLMIDKMLETGTIVKLNEDLRPNSYAARSHPSDVARVESRTFICSETEEEAGPLNKWYDMREMRERLTTKFAGSMRGRVMYVVPFSMGPLGSPLAEIGVQLTDHPYVVANMGVMTRMGKAALENLDEKGAFVPCVHSVGRPLAPGEKDVPWPCASDIEEKYIVHFPRNREINSYGSLYGGNALLGKKCFALRIASVMARDEGWLAEHMLILSMKSPEGVKKYMCAAFPSACGKTNLAMVQSTLPGWEIKTIGDDIAWLRPGPDGRLWAINPEAGFFGVAPGTSNKTNPSAIASLEKNALFTNVAVTKEGDVWWEGLTKEVPDGLTNWKGRPHDKNSGEPAAHPNSRFTAHAHQCPVMDEDWESPQGVPISAFIFGGRRPDTVPLVYQAFDWAHGTYLGATMSSEATAAGEDARPIVKHDPMAMKPFCGYHICDYWQHWLNVGEKLGPEKAPKIFFVNWFLKDENKKFVWPGFGENTRVLKWIWERSEGEGHANPDLAKKTPIGWVPAKDALDLSGLDLSEKDMATLTNVDVAKWEREVASIKSWLDNTFESHLPPEIVHQEEALQKRLDEAKK